MPDTLGSLAPLDWAVARAVNGPFQETPWIAYVFGAIIGGILIIAVFVWLIFGLADLVRRDDIGSAKKLLWLAAFILMPPVLIVYGAVRFNRTDGSPGG